MKIFRAVESGREVPENLEDLPEENAMEEKNPAEEQKKALPDKIQDFQDAEQNQETSVEEKTAEMENYLPGEESVEIQKTMPEQETAETQDHD